MRKYLFCQQGGIPFFTHHPKCVKNTREPSKATENNVYQQLNITSSLQEYSQRRQEKRFKLVRENSLQNSPKTTAMTFEPSTILFVYCTRMHPQLFFYRKESCGNQPDKVTSEHLPPLSHQFLRQEGLVGLGGKKKQGRVVKYESRPLVSPLGEAGGT